MRRPFVAGNWKMHHLTQDALPFVDVLREACDRFSDVDVALFPPVTLLSNLSRAFAGVRVRLGAQVCHQARQGAYTGELSPAHLSDVGAQLVLCGHSERRQIFGEDDAIVAARLAAAQEEGLEPILCVGETEDEREKGETEAVLKRQLTSALKDRGSDQVSRITLAYEPVWAIGTGKTATPDIAQEAHAFLRAELRALFGDSIADACRILYGGSVKPDNLAGLLDQPDIDGGLVGGASLQPESFVALIREASRMRPRSVD
ncbi:MAG: triose-phosphate isomerase [Acidobacteriota bacterium]